jgi:hypothetical protein
VTINDMSPPRDVAIAFPAFFATARALLYAIYGCGAISLFAFALRSVQRRWVAPAITIALLFVFQLDSSATTGAQLALSTVNAAVVTLAAWLIARYVLGDNPLAWPLALFTAVALQSAFAMLGNHRADLAVNGWAVVGVVVVVLTFFAMRGVAGSETRPTLPFEDAG